MKQLFEFPALIDGIVSDLFLSLDKYTDPNVLRTFFVERQNEADDLHAKLGEVNEYGGNILVVGEPGVGKTAFLRWFLDNSQFAKLQTPTFSLLDLRRQPAGAEDPTDFLRRFRQRLVTILLPELRRLGDPCNDVPNEDAAAMARYNYCADKLEKAKADKGNGRSHLIFVDDVDYIDEKCFCILLDQLRPVLLSPLFSLIIACRTPAFNTIQSHHDYTIAAAFEDARTLKLRALPTRSILEARLRILQGEPSFRRWYANPLVKPFVQIGQALARILTILPDTDDIAMLPYPFSPKQHNYMRAMSNGNIRHVLLMAQAFLRHMAANKNAISRDETGYRIGRQAAIDLFAASDTHDKVRLINVHSVRTFKSLTKAEIARAGIPPEKVGNSVYVVLLELYKGMMDTGESSALYVTQAMEALGVSQTEAERAAAELLELELIRERTLRAQTAMGSRDAVRLYELTDRGYFYVTYLIHWPEYAAKFGVSSHHVGLRDVDSRRKLETSLLEFLVNIQLVTGKKRNSRPSLDFKISRTEFLGAFYEHYGALIRQIGRLNEKAAELSIDDMSSILAGHLDVVREHRMEKSRNYYFIGTKLMELCNKRGAPFEERHIYRREEFEAFVERYVHPPDSEE